MISVSWRYRALGGVDIRVLYQGILPEVLNHLDRDEGAFLINLDYSWHVTPLCP
jgi:hypothetical protein